MKSTERSPVARYYDACYRLDEARLQGKRKRIAFLNYAVTLATEEAREALEYERAKVRSQVDDLFNDFKGIFGPLPPFPSIRKPI